MDIIIIHPCRIEFDELLLFMYVFIQFKYVRITKTRGQHGSPHFLRVSFYLCVCVSLHKHENDVSFFFAISAVRTIIKIPSPRSLENITEHNGIVIFSTFYPSIIRCLNI